MCHTQTINKVCRLFVFIAAVRKKSMRTGADSKCALVARVTQCDSQCVCQLASMLFDDAAADVHTVMCCYNLQIQGAQPAPQGKLRFRLRALNLATSSIPVLSVDKIAATLGHRPTSTDDQDWKF